MREEVLENMTYGLDDDLLLLQPFPSNGVLMTVSIGKGDGMRIMSCFKSVSVFYSFFDIFFYRHG